MRLLPGILKELTRHVPTVLFNSVDWNELALELPQISGRMLQKEGYQILYNYQKFILSSYPITLSLEKIKNPQILKKKIAGDLVLTLYFEQLFSDEGLFLDLRSHHFGQEDEKLLWHPSLFWTKFDEHFRLGLLKVYDGFYLENDEAYYQGLEDLGLTKKSFTLNEKNELGDLFRSHFGGAINQEMPFKISHLQESIIKMSNFLLKKKVKISKDFLYLGICLVTLYSTLDELGQEHMVKKIYFDVRKKHLKGVAVKCSTTEG
jgi:hypothetical protein